MCEVMEACPDIKTRVLLSEDCQHLNVDDNTLICRNCGVVLESGFHYEKITAQKQTKQHLLYDGMSVEGIPTYVLDKAEEISSKMYKIANNRNKRRVKRRFACLYYAYMELGLDVSPKHLCKVVGLDERDQSSALTMFSELHT